MRSRVGRTDTIGFMGESKPKKEGELSNEAVILRLLKISRRYRRAIDVQSIDAASLELLRQADERRRTA